MKPDFKVKSLAVTFLLAGTLGATAQQLSINKSTYNTAVGIRAGGTSGLTIKHFTSSGMALEGIIGLNPYWGEGFNATLLYEKHVNAFQESGFNWYYGAGGHVTAYQRGTYFHRYRGERTYYYTDSEAGIGIDGIIGLEYKIKPIPIAISFDLKPFVEVNTAGFGFASLDPGLGIKLTF